MSGEFETDKAAAMRMRECLDGCTLPGAIKALADVLADMLVQYVGDEQEALEGLAAFEASARGRIALMFAPEMRQ